MSDSYMEFVARTLSDMQKWGDKINEANDAAQMGGASPLMSGFHILQHTLVQVLEALINDHWRVVSHHVFDCAFGRNIEDEESNGDFMMARIQRMMELYRADAPAKGMGRSNQSIWALTTKSLIAAREQAEKIEYVGDLLQMSPNSPFLYGSYQIQWMLVRALELLVGASRGEIGWYVFETQYGRKPKQAGEDDDSRLIESVDDLRWLVELYQDEREVVAGRG